MTEKTTSFAAGFDNATLITGGSKGIGSGCARVFTRAGARVVICDIDEETGRALAEELTATGPGIATLSRAMCVSRPRSNG